MSYDFGLYWTFTHLFPKKRTVNSGEDCVTVYYWPQGPYSSAGILDVEVTEGGKTEYLSFFPKSLKGIDRIPFAQLKTGRGAGFLSNIGERCLVEGLRRKWSQYKRSDLNEQQLAIITRVYGELSVASSQADLSARAADTKEAEKAKDALERFGKADGNTLLNALPIGQFGDHEKLALAKLFREEERESLIADGQSACQATLLRDLDLSAMTTAIRAYKDSSKNMLWAPIGGMTIHHPDTENCASIVARVLEKGGLREIVPASNDFYGKMGFCIGVAALIIFLLAERPWEGMMCLALIYAAGRFIGGMAEGVNGASSLYDVMEREKKPYATSVARVGLIAANALVGGVVGLVSSDNPSAKGLVLPADVWNTVCEVECLQKKDAGTPLGQSPVLLPASPMRKRFA